VVIGELVENRRNKLFEARAELRKHDVVLADATGKYLPVKGDVLAEMLSDFAESTEKLFE